MNIFVTAPLVVSIGLAFLVLLVVATTYVRPEQTGLSVQIRKDREDLIWIVSGSGGLIVLNFCAMVSSLSNELGISIVVFNVVVQVLLIWLMVSSWRYAYKRHKGPLCRP